MFTCIPKMYLTRCKNETLFKMYGIDRYSKCENGLLGQSCEEHIKTKSIFQVRTKQTILRSRPVPGHAMDMRWALRIQNLRADHCKKHELKRNAW